MSVQFYLHTLGEALALLCAAGLVGVCLRWRDGGRRDLLLAVALILSGVIVRELAVWLYGSAGWAPDSPALYLVTLSRGLLLSGVAVYVRGALRGRWGEWGAPLVLLAALLGALLVP